MPRTFQRPKNLPTDIPIYHITFRDADADLLIKIIAPETNKTAVIPAYKEDLVEILPAYFGKIFDRNKGYEYKENRLKKGEYYEIEIPNLKEPENLAIFLKNLCCQSLLPDQVLLGGSKNEKVVLIGGINTIVVLDDQYDWPEFYWIANYFNEESILSQIISKLIKTNPDFCHDLLLNYQVGKELKDKIKTAISEEEFDGTERTLVRKLLQPETAFDIELIRDLSDLCSSYKVDLALMTKSYCIPIECHENRKFTCRFSEEPSSNFYHISKIFGRK